MDILDINLDHAVLFLTQKDKERGCFAVSCRYEPDTVTKTARRQVYKTFDHGISPGDLVVVPTDRDHRIGYTTAIVDKVHVPVDYRNIAPMEFIVARVPLGPYRNLLDMEKAAKDSIRARQERKAAEQLTELVLDEETQKDMKRIGLLPQTLEDAAS